jgi:hypothetical protein
MCWFGGRMVYEQGMAEVSLAWLKRPVLFNFFQNGN